MYISDIVRNGLVKHVKDRITKIDIDAILDSNYIVEIIEDSNKSDFAVIVLSSPAFEPTWNVAPDPASPSLSPNNFNEESIITEFPNLDFSDYTSLRYTFITWIKPFIGYNFINIDEVEQERQYK